MRAHTHAAKNTIFIRYYLSDFNDLSTHYRSFTKVAKTSEIPIGKMKAVKLNDEEVLISNVNGSFYAIANSCIHKGGNLSEGTLEGNIVTCPLHGSKFDVITGKCIYRHRSFLGETKTDDAVSHELRVDGEDILLYLRSSWGI